MALVLPGCSRVSLGELGGLRQPSERAPADQPADGEAAEPLDRPSPRAPGTVFPSDVYGRTTLPEDGISGRYGGRTYEGAAPAKPRPARAALLVPLSGPHGELGQALLNAAQMALFDVADRRFILIPYDTAGTPEGARQAALSALDDGATIILGPLFSTSVAAVARTIRGLEVPVLAFSSDRLVAEPGIYPLGLFPGEQIRRAVSYAREQGHERFAVFAPDTPLGRAVVEALSETLTRKGGVLVQVELFPDSTADVTPQVKQLADYEARQKALEEARGELADTLAAAEALAAGERQKADRLAAARGLDLASLTEDDLARIEAELKKLKEQDTLGDVNFDALVLPLANDRVLQIAPLLSYYDIDPNKVKFIGTSQWDTPNLGNEPALVGGWFAAPDPDDRARFETDYAQLFGAPPPRLATLAYDATALAAFLGRGTDGPDFSRTQLQSAKGFAGLDGVFRLKANGLSERRLAVLEVRPKGIRTVSPAPQRFEDLSN